MPFDKQYNLNKELCDYLEVLYETLDWLEDIRIALEKEESVTDILSPPPEPEPTTTAPTHYVFPFEPSLVSIIISSFSV
jgi:hypothetical protein